MSVVAVIPARAGSKGLPGKNIRKFRGVPLLGLAIQRAKECSAIDRIVVSTDSKEYARLAREFGAEVPFLRPAELATDSANDLVTFQHCLKALHSLGYSPELVVHLRPTYPLRTPAQISECIRMLQADREAESVRSVSISRYSPYKTYKIASNRLAPVAECGIEEAYNQPRQNLPDTYEHNGAIDVVRAKVVLGGSMSGRVIVPFIMEHNFDIDTLADFEEAEKAPY
jgi:CMP-N-acetylneuraminic acid synthetase